MSAWNNSEKLKHWGRVWSLYDDMEIIKDTGVYLPAIQRCAAVCEEKHCRKHPIIYFVLRFRYNHHPYTVVMCKVCRVEAQGT